MTLYVHCKKLIWRTWKGFKKTAIYAKIYVENEGNSVFKT
jgi:hypothetical protein